MKKSIRVKIIYLFVLISSMSMAQNEKEVLNVLKKSGNPDSISLTSDFFEAIERNDTSILFRLIPNELLIYALRPSCNDEAMRQYCDSLNSRKRSSVYFSLVYEPFKEFQKELGRKTIDLSSLKIEEIRITELNDSLSKVLPIKLFRAEYFVINSSNNAKYTLSIGSICLLYSRWFILEVRPSILKS